MVFSIRDLVLTRAQRAGYCLHVERLAVRAGQCLAITGASGCGKSTALDVLGMVLRPDSVQDFIFSPAGIAVDVGAAWQRQDVDFMAALRREHVGYVLQTGGLLPYLSVEDNIALPARMKGLPEEALRDHLRELAHCLDIGGLLSALPGTLSVGERQRAAIARALAARPEVVLADEPTAALDPLHARQVMEMFLQAVTQSRTTLIMVTHDARIVSSFGLREVSMQLHHEQGMTTAVLHDGSTD